MRNPHLPGMPKTNKIPSPVGINVQRRPETEKEDSSEDVNRSAKDLKNMFENMAIRK